MELGLRGSGLRGEALPFGESVRVRCAKGLGEEGESGGREFPLTRCCGGGGWSFIEKSFSEFWKAVPVLFVDVREGDCEGDGEAIASLVQ